MRVWYVEVILMLLCFICADGGPDPSQFLISIVTLAFFGNNGHPGTLIFADCLDFIRLAEFVVRRKETVEDF